MSNVFNYLTDCKPADIILTCSDGWLSNLVQWGTHSNVSHGLMSLYPGEIIEVGWKIQRKFILDALENKKFIIIRHRFLSCEKRNQIALRFLSIEEQFYGIGKLGLAGLDVLSHTYFFTKYFGLTNFKDCTNGVAWSYYQEFKGKLWDDKWEQRMSQDLVFGVPWRCVRPDTIKDYVLKYPEEWEILENTINET